MSEFTITGTRISKGVWSGTLIGPATSEPNIKVTHFEQTVAGTTVSSGSDEGTWTLSVPISNSVISDGVQTFIVTDANDGTKIADFTVIVGEVIGDDLRAEVELLRAELDMLKRAFRRHCTETS